MRSAVTVSLDESQETDPAVDALDAEDRGDFDAAVEAYHAWLLRDGPSQQVCYNLGVALFHCGNFEASAERFRQAIEIDPAVADAQNNLGLALFRGGRVEEAIEPLRQALALNPAHREAHFNLAKCHERLGEIEAAASHFQSAIDFGSETEDELSSHATARLTALGTG